MKVNFASLSWDPFIYLPLQHFFFHINVIQKVNAKKNAIYGVNIDKNNSESFFSSSKQSPGNFAFHMKNKY